MDHLEDSESELTWEEAWDAEIACRMESLSRGETKTVPWEEVHRRLLQIVADWNPGKPTNG